MRKDLMTLVAVLALTSCSSDSLVGESPVNNEAPIAFTVSQRNSTRAANEQNLQDAGYEDFGVWAYKYKEANTPTGVAVMNNYKVAYDKTSTSWDYVGKATGQVLRYWDLSYNNTKFFAYAPYNKEGVSFNESTKTITVTDEVNKAGTEHDVIYAGKVMTNSEHAKVPLQFKHLGAKVNLQFYADVPGYTVELLEVTSGENDIKAEPVTSEGQSAKYFTKSEATIVYGNDMTATATINNSGEADSNAPLSFKITEDASGSKVVPQAVTTGDQNYLKSPTTYYAVGQPTTSTTGFQFHISYKLTATDNSEVIEVKDAKVFVPASTTVGENTTYIAAWQPNTAYTYTFKIKVDNNGPLYPIVFDNITIVDYENSESNI
jgi:hypothetical protein